MNKLLINDFLNLLVPMGPEGTKWERNLPPIVVSVNTCLEDFFKRDSLLMFHLIRTMLLLTTTKLYKQFNKNKKRTREPFFIHKLLNYMLILNYNKLSIFDDIHILKKIKKNSTTFCFDVIYRKESI